MRIEIRSHPAFARRRALIGGLLCSLLAPVAVASAGDDEKKERTSRISDESVASIDPDSIPKRPRPLLEFGNSFLGSGELRPGFHVLGGSVWQPGLIVFGTLRTAVQAFNNDTATASEWANRLDLFTNLQLTGTERILFGLRPVDEDGDFSGQNFKGAPTGSREAYNQDIASLFFEGNLGEMFPGKDPTDFDPVDWGFAVGRQPLLFQEGMLINDDLDGIGLTRNTLLPRGGSDLQVTLFYAWDEVHRDDNLEDDGAEMFALFLGADYPVSTWNADFAWVFDAATGNDGLYWGVSQVRRFGHWNSSLRLLGSQALEFETDAVSDGFLAFGEFSWTPPWTHDLLYLATFWGIDRFSSAARGPATGGPLGRTGILYAAVGLGRYGAPLGNRADDSAGFSVGYQKFSHSTRRQVIFELGGRQSTAGFDDAEAAFGIRFQQAIRRRLVLQLDGFTKVQERRDAGWGGRVELRVSF